ncbi:MAG: hypothetical protein RSB55_07260 [Oscillospiraceae bacterium]
MREDVMRTVGYLCPACRQPVLIERSEFELLSGKSKLTCPCGKSEVIVEPEGSEVKLTVPCLTCGESHVVFCTAHALLHQRALAFSCGKSGLDCCYVGDAKTVFEAMSRLEEATDKLDETAAETGDFLDELMVGEVLAELRDIAARDGISCTCGSRKWQIKLGYSAIDLTCTSCGGRLRIPAATASDLEDVCCKNQLVIRGRER